MSRALPLALAAGAAWGAVMAFFAWRWEGAELVLMQSWLFLAAWLFGRAARRPGAGALAGLAFVAGAVWVYELLPGWGFEAAIRRENPGFAAIEVIAQQFDATDIALFSTLAVGALIGLGGALSREAPAEAAQAAPVAVPQPPPPPPPPAPLWAPSAPAAPAEAAGPAVPPPPPAPPPREPDRSGLRRSLGAALLLAAVATDVVLDRLFGFLSDTSSVVATVLVVAVLGVVIRLARRFTVVAVLAGLALATGFAAVQNAEYDARRAAVEVIR